MIDYEAYRFFENEDGMKEFAKEMINKNIDLAKSLQFELNAQLQDKEVAEGSIDWDIKVPKALTSSQKKNINLIGKGKILCL